MTQKPRLVLALIILLGLTVLYWVGQRRQHFQETAIQNLPSVPNPESLADPEVMSQFLAVETRQNELDQTVWAKELLAEKYEEVFIRLWDELRGQEDKFSILKRLDFGQLVLGNPMAPDVREWGIKVIRFEPQERRLTKQDWRQWLQESRAQGYEIEETEWRHPRFDPDKEKPGSVIALTAPYWRLLSLPAFEHSSFWTGQGGERGLG